MGGKSGQYIILMMLENGPPEEWFQKHPSVSDEDFEKEPHRNKLNVLLNRINHPGIIWGN